MADSDRSEPAGPAEAVEPVAGPVDAVEDGVDPVEDGVVDWLAVMGNPTPVPAEVSTGSSTESPTEPPVEPQREDDSELELVSMRRIAAIACLLVVGYLLVTLVDVWIASRGTYEGDAQAAVVLGAAQYNGEPSPALRGRLDRAAELYEAGRVPLVVVTGGGQDADITTEAKTGYDYLRSTAGISDEDLRLEVDGTSTYESLAATARFLAAEEIDRVIIVTDPYHARRSLLIADEVGLDAVVVPTDAGVSIGRLLRETAGTAVGRLVGFRRSDAYIDV